MLKVLLILILSSWAVIGNEYRPYKIKGHFLDEWDLSSIICQDRTCLVASDEINQLQILKKKNNTMEVTDRVIDLGDSQVEFDLEAMTKSGTHFYATTSHSLNRKHNEYHPERYQIFKFKFDKDNFSDFQTHSLSNVIMKNNVISAYFKRPIDEQGIDIEGMAYANNSLFIGLRSPLIDGKAVIIKVNANDFFEHNSKASETLLVDLDGHGIRGMDFHAGNLFVVSGKSLVEQKQKAALWKLNLKGEVLKKYAVPKSKKKLEGVHILDKHNAIFIYDSLKQGHIGKFTF
jgi:hypothetical protein